MSSSRSNGSVNADPTPSLTGLGDQLRGSTSQIVDEFRTAAEQMVDEHKHRAADTGDQLAEAIRQSVSRIDPDHATPVVRYAEAAAQEIEDWSSRLRDRSIGGLLEDTASFARRQPELFMAGAAVAGFLLGRFLKASKDEQRWTAGPRPAAFPDDPQAERWDGRHTATESDFVEAPPLKS